MRPGINQIALLEALRRAEGATFPTHKAWAEAATSVYLELKPDGSNAWSGPLKAITSVVRRGWVESVRAGKGKRVVLTAAGLVCLLAKGTEPERRR